MSSDIIQQITATIQFEPHADTEGGCLLLIPTAAVKAFVSAGIRKQSFTVEFIGGESQADWLTLSDAARLHTTDVDGMTLARAKNKIGRACQAGRISAEGSGFSRRLDPVSFNAWRLGEREKDLAKLDDI